MKLIMIMFEHAGSSDHTARRWPNQGHKQHERRAGEQPRCGRGVDRIQVALLRVSTRILSGMDSAGDSAPTAASDAVAVVPPASRPGRHRSPANPAA